MSKKLFLEIIVVSLFFYPTIFSMMSKFDLEERLIDAIWEKDLNKVKKMVEIKGASPNGITKKPILSAATKENIAIVKYLIQQGADPCATCPLGSTAISGSLWKDTKAYMQVLKYLVVRGAVIEEYMFKKASEKSKKYIKKVYDFRNLEVDKKVKKFLKSSLRDFKLYAPVFFYESVIGLLCIVNNIGIQEDSFECAYKNSFFYALHSFMRSKKIDAKYKEVVAKSTLKYFDVDVNYQEEESNKFLISLLNLLAKANKSILAQKALKARRKLEFYLVDKAERLSFLRMRRDFSINKINFKNKAIVVPVVLFQ